VYSASKILYEDRKKLKNYQKILKKHLTNTLKCVIINTESEVREWQRKREGAIKKVTRLLISTSSQP
jgi:hypothetical protein